MKSARSACAMVLAGGEGRRAGTPKQFSRAGGHTLLYHACSPFLGVDAIGGLVVVVPQGRQAQVEDELAPAAGRKSLAVVSGGATRQESSRRGLAGVPSSFDLILIHDAARPFVSADLIERVITAASENGAAIPVLPLKDAVIELEETESGTSDGGKVRKYLSRQALRAVQTPQGFTRELLERAFAHSASSDSADDGQVALAAGAELVLVEGEENNHKITNRKELEDALRYFEEKGT